MSNNKIKEKRRLKKAKQNAKKGNAEALMMAFEFAVHDAMEHLDSKPRPSLTQEFPYESSPSFESVKAWYLDLARRRVENVE